MHPHVMRGNPEMDKKTLPHTESDQWQDQGKSGPVVIFGPRIIYGSNLISDVPHFCCYDCNKSNLSQDLQLFLL